MNVDLKLDEECWRCVGSGVNFDLKTNERIDGPCPSCGGKGRRPTDDGRKLLEFIHRYAQDQEKASR